MSPSAATSRQNYYTLSDGSPKDLGAVPDFDGVNFAVFSQNATQLDLCLFSDDGRKELQRIPMTARSGDVWHVHVGGLSAGAKYGFRAHGPYAPEEGHRFNPNKLLLDPYARKISGTLRWSDTLLGYKGGSSRGDLSFDTRDSAFAMPKAEVVHSLPAYPPERRPKSPDVPLNYEAHVKGLTKTHPQIARAIRGSFLGMSAPPMLEHLTALGITTVQIMPAQAFLDDRFLVEKNLRNYWGYNTIGFFAPEPRYMSQNQIWEFQSMVAAFHAAGIEVIMDVVYNHTAEGNEQGPTLSFRGLDNASYYRLQSNNRRLYDNDTGTGNVVNMSHPYVLRMVMDSLRYWVEIMGVDGFRFDLATTLARGPNGFEREGAFLQAIRQDPVLRGVKLIAEPWDIGPGGYQLGAFPHPFLELNDRFRDEVRRFWTGESHLTPALATRVLGSSDEFDHAARDALTSVNFVTAHDGFTLEDVVSYNTKHNEANGEDNRDGHGANFSDNCGVEGPTEDPLILAKRALRKRNLMATMFLSQGTPMLLAGDEIGNTQGGNNNAYAQDNATGWIDWAKTDTEFLDFIGRLSALRHAHPVLHQRDFLHGQTRKSDGMRDLVWLKPDGTAPGDADWHDPAWRALCVEIRTSAEVPAGDREADPLWCCFNNGEAVTATLPAAPAGHAWALILDTTDPACRVAPIHGPTLDIPATSTIVAALIPHPTKAKHL
ncbi:Glycogen debranching enzyme [Aquimixticola soesokkakensis]|uniref:Glycogen debranching enzyme n=1 Tax=Aquimixticola soesokkakensis TaxID=1519096 RepID=A0A1Y5STS0_9RHOB|nr:glycogen debranching protein GlgX [Aquimixticola soesokkakensis]SLN44890.1 Glycogen debranching enzyme [Aquimixticola soesokkakensis]